MLRRPGCAGVAAEGAMGGGVRLRFPATEPAMKMVGVHGLRKVVALRQMAAHALKRGALRFIFNAFC